MIPDTLTARGTSLAWCCAELADDHPRDELARVVLAPRKVLPATLGVRDIEERVGQGQGRSTILGSEKA